MRILILGAGPAGISVAEHMRTLEKETGTRHDISMASAEPFPPYSPPAMADHFLTGREASLYWKGKDICNRLEIDYYPGRVTRAVDPADHTVTFDDGFALHYDKLVIATGSRLYAPLEGCELPGIYNFKSLSAARQLAGHAREGEIRRAVIVGAGFIGVEVALLLADLELEVTLIEQQDRVMSRMLDVETAGIVADALRGRGVTLMSDTEASAFVGSRQADAVELANGAIITADACIAATGVKPNLDCLSGAGLRSNWGVSVDQRLRTSVPDVWAAGDVAETIDRMSGERYVHAIFPNAVAQGQIVAEQLLGFDSVYEGAESMNSLRHLGLPVIAAGRLTGDTELVMRGDKNLRKIILEDGRIVGFRLAGDMRGAGVYRSLMLRCVDVGQLGERLLDAGHVIAAQASPLQALAA